MNTESSAMPESSPGHTIAPISNDTPILLGRCVARELCKSFHLPCAADRRRVKQLFGCAITAYRMPELRRNAPP